MLKRSALIILAVLLAAMVPIFAAPSQQAPPAKGQAVNTVTGQKHASDPQGGAHNAPLAVEAHVTGELKTTAENPGEGAHPENNRWFEPISIFTFLLVLVGAGQGWFLYQTNKGTQKAAEAAKQAAKAAMLQARAAVASEISELIIPRADLVPYPDSPPGVPDITISAGNISCKEMRCTITIGNAGRSKSRISEVCLEWLIVPRVSKTENPDPPKIPIYDHIIGIGMFLTPDQVVPLKWSGEKNSIIRLSDDELAAINRDKAWLWIYGRIKYSDFMGDRYDLGFAAHWEAVAGTTIGTTTIPVARGFVMEGPPPYVYRNKRRNNDA